MYHNIKSFRKHSGQVENDAIFMASDIILYGEAWMFASGKLELQDPYAGHVLTVYRNVDRGSHVYSCEMRRYVVHLLCDGSRTGMIAIA